MKYRKLKITAIVVSTFFSSQVVFAGSGWISSATISNISLYGPGYPDPGHKDGNMEITLSSGSFPAGVSCNNTYLSTLRSSDPDRAMLALLRDAKNSNKAVSLFITDDAKYTAYPNRCSIQAVTVQ